MPKIVTFKAPAVSINCSAIAGGTPGQTAFGNCTDPANPAGGCGCTPFYSTCPPGSAVVACSTTQLPNPAGIPQDVYGTGADWSIGTSLIKPEDNTCIGIWINTARVPRESQVTVAAVCSKFEKKGW